MKKNSNYRIDLMMVILFFCIIFIFMGSLIKNERTYSATENRRLNTFQHFTVSKFLSGEYQDSLEDALADQAIGSETIKRFTSNVLKFIKYDKIPEVICKNKYVNFDGYYSYNCGDYLVKRLYSYYHEGVKGEILETLKQYSNLNEEIDTYYYFITTSDIYNFDTNDYEIDVPSFVVDNMKGDYKLEVFDFDDYDEYTKYFYKTDHHWNYKGSYKGYTEIMRMLKPKDKVIVPEEEVEFDNLKFYGSASRMTKIFDFSENFKVYKFDFPKFDISNNRESPTYGDEENYFNNKYLTDKLTNHYGYYYGGDSGEVIFDTHRNSKENLLIISNSYSNAVNKLIASHFNETYVVDLRNYLAHVGEEFELYEYIEHNDIDKVLVVFNYQFLIGDAFHIE